MTFSMHLFQANHSGKLMSRLTNDLNNLGARLSETLGAQKIVKAFNAAGHERERFRKVNESFTADRKKAAALRARVEPAVVGPTSSGKSALAALVPRFFDVDGGAVLIDGHDVRPMRARREGRGGHCAAPHARRYPWAELMKRVFAVDLLHCAGCGGRRVILAAITQATVVAAILTSLGLPTEVPVRHPARPPPGFQW